MLSSCGITQPTSISKAEGNHKQNLLFEFLPSRGEKKNTSTERPSQTFSTRATGPPASLLTEILTDCKAEEYSVRPRGVKRFRFFLGVKAGVTRVEGGLRKPLSFAGRTVRSNLVTYLYSCAG